MSFAEIPPTLTKCCLACFKRITRRLAPHLQLEPAEQVADVESSFSEDDILKMKTLLQEHDTNWKTIADVMSKPINYIKSFYFNFRTKYGLDNSVSEFNKLKFSEDMKPVLTDEEESGSSTSSCDETTELHNSDTASAESPNHPIAQSKSESDNMNEPMILDGINASPVFPAIMLPGQMLEDKSRLLGMPPLPCSDNLTSPTILSQPPPMGLSQPPSKIIVTKDEYDSSATETADEENESPTNRQSPKVLSITQNQSPYPSQTTITVVPGNQHNGPVQNLQVQGQSRLDSNSPLTVRDVMLNVIERTLMKKGPSMPPQQQLNNNQQQQQKPSNIVQPKNDSRNDITFVREYRQEPVNKNMLGTPLSSHRQGSESLATLSVVNSHGHVQQPMHQQQLLLSPQIAATITPVNQASSQSQDNIPKDGLVVVQIQQEPQTLDLSIKKPRDQNFGGPPPPAHSKPLHSLLHSSPQGSGQPPKVTVYRTDPSYIGYHHNAEQNRLSKSPLVYVSPVPNSQHNMSQIPQRGQQTIQSQQPISQAKLSKAAPRLSPKISSHGPKGSITHGTPVNSSQPPQMQQQNSSSLSPRFDILRQTPPETKIGSITQGTPVHMPPYHLPDKRVMYEYFGPRNDKRQSPQSSAPGTFSPYSQAPAPQTGSPSTSVVGVSSGGGTFTSPTPYSRPPSYGLEQRQIIMADFITSQQMHGSHQRRTSQEQPPIRQPTYISTRGSPAEHLSR